MQLVVLGMHCGHRDAEHAHDRHDSDAGERFEHGVACERRERNGVALAGARRKRPAVHCCHRQHRRDQDELRDKESAVVARRQRRQAADEIDAAERAGRDQDSDAERPQDGKSPRRARREIERRALAALSRCDQQTREARQGADPRSCRQQMQHVGAEAKIAFGSLPAGGMSRERGQGEIRAGRGERG
jgi:hypothetical protein